MKTFYDFIRRTSGKLNEAAGDEYDLTKEEDIFSHLLSPRMVINIIN